MKNLCFLLLLSGFFACKKSDSVYEPQCAAYELVNNTRSSVNPLTYINSCASYAGNILPGASDYLMGDEQSIVVAEGLVWEKLREMPLRKRKVAQVYVPELSIFRSSPTSDGNAFSPSMTFNLDLLHVKYWDTSRVKHEIIVSAEGGLPQDVNATVVVNATLEDQTQKTFNITFENAGKLMMARKTDVPVSYVRAHWRFWKYKYQNGQRMTVNGKYITEPLGEVEQIEAFQPLD